MGVVQAKGLPAEPMNSASEHNEEVDLNTLPAKVIKVNVDGLRRTKNDLVIKEVRDILKADNFEDIIKENRSDKARIFDEKMIRRSYEAKTRLDKLGIFKRVMISVDTSKDPRAGKEGYDVTFDVEEIRRITGGINTLVGTNEGSLLINLKMPNVFGRAEKLNLDYTYGSNKSGGSSLTYTVPVKGDPLTIFTAGVYEHHADFPWSGYSESDRGPFIDLNFLSGLGSHSIRWEGIWRELFCLNNTTSFAVREQTGSSLKSSLKHIFIRDMRDNPIIPNYGSYLRISQELAGLGGNVEFVKGEVEYQANQTLPFDTVLQLSVAGGVMRPLSLGKQDTSEIRINDKFFLGGPLTMRGFNMKGIGPSKDGNALGADAYWLCGLHLYTPLPFRPGRGGFGDLFRTHLFINAGNLSNINFNAGVSDNFSQLTDDIRLSAGGGIVLKMGRIARMELNYCWPLRVMKGDSINYGVQFGIGVHFL